MDDDVRDVASRREFAVQYGSTLRNVGKLDEARSVLAGGVRTHPDFPALRLFLALAQYTAGEHAAAARDAIAGAVAEDPHGSRERYRRSLRAYAAELAEGDDD